MSANKHPQNPPFVLSCFRDSELFFGPPPILSGEDPEIFYKLGQALWDSRPPEDFIQATRVVDIAYLLWEGSRMRRLKVKLIDSSRVQGAKRLIGALDPTYRGEAFWRDWLLGDQETVDYINELLDAAGLDQDAIVAQTLAAIIDSLEAIERQSAQFEARRLVTIRDMDQYSENAERRRAASRNRKRQVRERRPESPVPGPAAERETAPQLPLNIEAAE